MLMCCVMLSEVVKEEERDNNKKKSPERGSTTEHSSDYARDINFKQARLICFVLAGSERVLRMHPPY